MTNPTHKTVNVQFSHTAHERANVDINLAEYREWLDIAPDEDFEFTEREIQDYLWSGDPQFEITGRYGLEDFAIEQVTFERDC